MGRVIKLTFYFFLYQLAVSGVLAIIYMLGNDTGEIPNPADGSPYIVYLLTVQVVFTLALCIHLLLGKYVSLNRRTLAYYKSGKVLFLSFMLIVGMSLWNNYLNELADFPNTMESFFKEMMHRPSGIITTVVLAPLMEELFFRGAIEGHLLQVWKKPVWAIVFSSLLFGVVHGNPAQIPFAFIVGLALGWMYYVTGSLVPCVFMHFINNGSAVLLFWLMGDSESTLIGTLGDNLAAVMAVVGVGITVVSVLAIRKLIKNPIQWNKEECSSSVLER